LCSSRTSKKQACKNTPLRLIPSIFLLLPFSSSPAAILDLVDLLRSFFFTFSSLLFSSPPIFFVSLSRFFCCCKIPDQAGYPKRLVLKNARYHPILLLESGLDCSSLFETLHSRDDLLAYSHRATHLISSLSSLLMKLQSINRPILNPQPCEFPATPHLTRKSRQPDNPGGYKDLKSRRRRRLRCWCHDVRHCRRLLSTARFYRHHSRFDVNHHPHCSRETFLANRFSGRAITQLTGLGMLGTFTLGWGA
jgi:hypothetical protein